MLDIFPRTELKIPVQLVDATGKVLEEQTLPTATDDMRKFATFNLPREGSYYLRLPGGHQLPIQATEAPVNIQRLILQ